MGTAPYIVSIIYSTSHLNLGDFQSFPSYGGHTFWQLLLPAGRPYKTSAPASPQSKMLRSSCILLLTNLLILTSLTRVCLPMPMPGGATSMTESMAAFNIAGAPNVYVWPGEEEQVVQESFKSSQLVSKLTLFCLTCRLIIHLRYASLIRVLYQ